MIQLLDKVNNDTTLVEFYLFQQNLNNIYDVNTNNDIISKIYNKYSNWKKNKYVSFYRNNLIYQYDCDNDYQNMFSKNIQKYSINNNILMISYNISKLPLYMFSCTDDIDVKTEYVIEEYKISNRISLNIKTENNTKTLYIEYKHSPQAENEKNEMIINKMLKEING